MTPEELAADAEMLAHTLRFVDEWFDDDPWTKDSEYTMRMVIAVALEAHQAAK